MVKARIHARATYHDLSSSMSAQEEIDRENERMRVKKRGYLRIKENAEEKDIFQRTNPVLPTEIVVLITICE